MTADHDPLPPAAALALLADGLDDTVLGAWSGRPALVLDLSDPVDPSVLARLPRVLAGAPCVVVGVAPDPIPDRAFEGVLDVALCAGGPSPAPWVACGEGLAAEVGRLVAAIEESPDASVALVQLLRLSRAATVVEAVLAESFVYSLLQGSDRHRQWLDARSTRSRHPRPERPVVHVTRVDGELSVVLDRPEVRNAYGTRMRDELVEAFRLVAADPTIQRVVVRGEGPSFSSGGDLDEFGTAPAPLTAHLVRTTRNAGIALAEIADRVTVHVHGPCVGAGVELPAFASTVVADDTTTFLLPEIAMGLIPGAGGTSSIPRRIGRHRTAFLALSGRPIDAPTAFDWGLVDSLVPGVER